MPTSLVQGYDADGDSSYEPFINYGLILAEGGGGASVTLGGGNDEISEVLTVYINSADFLQACPGLSSSSQITQLLIRTRLTTNNGGGTLSVLFNGLYVAFPSFGGGGYAYIDTDVTSEKTDLDYTVFAAIDTTLGIQITSTPFPGSNTITVDALVLQVTYTVTGSDGTQSDHTVLFTLGFPRR